LGLLVNYCVIIDKTLHGATQRRHRVTQRNKLPLINTTPAGVEQPNHISFFINIQTRWVWENFRVIIQIKGWQSNINQQQGLFLYIVFSISPEWHFKTFRVFQT
jgi:hypothetical protein